ncbi:NudC domain-containing protein 3 [Entomophthora muscae]|uniref:NudC domain-containing protein 3 n=1 Tax=Entomophthora muscae TaxID=34485 RepID=A0ACC2TUK7_9FUNG|nr:NudC domain-containing protein 3 [Entomophthora muscae]
MDKDKLLSPHTAMYVGTAALAQDGPNMLLVVGGKNVKLEEGLLVLRENGIEPLRTHNASFPEPHRSMQTYCYAGAFVKDTGHKDSYYLLGRFFRRDNIPNETFKDVVLRYSAQSNSWEDMGATNGPRRYHYTATLYRDSIYLMGGMSADTDHIMPLTSVWQYNISRQFWEEKKCGSAVLGGRALHSSVLIGSCLHVVGRANQEVDSGQVDVLDLSTLLCETIKVEGLHGKSQGCLVH